MKKKEVQALTIEKYSKDFKDNFTLAKAAIECAYEIIESDKEFVLSDAFKAVQKKSKEKK